MKRSLIALFASFLLTSLSLAQYQQNCWPTRGDSLGIMVRSGTNIEWNRQAAADDSGNWYFCWSACSGGDRGVFLGKLDHDGNLLWRTTVNNGPDIQIDPVLCVTPTGVVVSWIDCRNARITPDGCVLQSLYVQKISVNGNRLWNISNSNDTIHVVPLVDSVVVVASRIIPDNSGGVYIFWGDCRANQLSNIYVTRFLANGQIANGFTLNGILIAVGAGDQFRPPDYDLITDGRGGVWVSWVDNRVTGDPNIYLQQVRPNGTTRWDSSGHALITSTSDQSQINIASDGRGGAFLVWRDGPRGLDENLYVQRIDSVGISLWETNGVPLLIAARKQTNPRIIASGIDHAIVSWEDFRNSSDFENIYANRITGATSLTKLWGDSGVAVCVDANYHKTESRLCPDGANDCAVVWQDERTESSQSLNFNLYAQRITSTGTPAWTTNGVVVTDANNSQQYPIVNWSTDRILSIWSDSRNGSYPLYRTVLDLNGNPIHPTLVGGAELIPDLSSGNINDNRIVCSEPDRFFTVWIDDRYGQYYNYRLYFSLHRTSDGMPIDTTRNGQPITLDSTNSVSQGCFSNSDQSAVVPTSDHGLIVVYTDYRGDNAETIRAQKISRTGERLWGDFGTQVVGSVQSPDCLNGASDDNNGVYFAFTVSILELGYLNKVYFQHVNASGQPLLGNFGTPILATDYEQTFSSCTKSGDNVYTGFIEASYSGNDIYRIQVLRMNPDGTHQWVTTIADSSTPSSSTTGPTGNRQYLKMMPGLDGSVIAYWQEYRRDTGGTAQIYAQCVNPDGSIQWEQGGKRVGTSNYCQYNACAIPVSDGYWFAWVDNRLSGCSQIFAQHLLDNGTKLLGDSGQLVTSSTSYQSTLDLAPLDSNGVMVVFQSTYYDSIYYNKIGGTPLRSDGTIMQPSLWNDQSIIANPALAQEPKVARIPGANAAIVNYIDGRSRFRNSDRINLSTQRVTFDPVAVESFEPAIPTGFTLSQNWPNPFNSSTQFRFTLPLRSDVKVTVTDILGRTMYEKSLGSLAPGSYTAHWNGQLANGAYASSGTYFLKVKAGEQIATKKIALIK